MPLTKSLMAEEYHPYKKPTRSGWKSAIFIIFVEVAEKFAYFGVAGNLFTYLTKVLGQPTATAAKNVNIWQGVSAVFPVIGGYLVDSYIGRFKTIIIASLCYLIGLILLTAAVSVVPLQLRYIVFFIAIYILSIGEGGYQPCVLTFAADQFEEDIPEEKEAKSSFFNWWYIGTVMGATSATLVAIYVQDYVGWSFGYGMLAVAIAIALVMFLIGSRGYHMQAPSGSPFPRVAQVVVAAVRKRRLSEMKERDVWIGDNESGDEGAPVQALARTSRFRYLDKAMMMEERDATSESRNPWRLCSMNQVEEAKLVFQLVPVWLCCLTFAVVFAQLSTYFTKQGSTMDRSITARFQIPAASFQVFTGLTMFTSVLLYDCALVPFARRLSGHPSGITILQRIGTGLGLSIITMVVAGLVEWRRLRIARDNGLLDSPQSPVPMAVWWLLPQYMVVGLSDMLTVVGLQELFYEQMPTRMRSIGAAAYITVFGVGNFLSSGLISIVQAITYKLGDVWLADNINRSNLHYFYWLLAAMSSLNFVVYVYVAKRFMYKKIEHGQRG